MTKKVEVEKISTEVLDDQWHDLLLKAFFKLREAVEAAKARGLDQKMIGQRVGMNDGQLSRVLKGEANVTLRTMHKIARAVDCRLEVDFCQLADLKKPNAPEWKISIPNDVSVGRLKSPASLTGSSLRAQPERLHKATWENLRADFVSGKVPETSL